MRHSCKSGQFFKEHPVPIYPDSSGFLLFFALVYADTSVLFPVLSPQCPSRPPRSASGRMTNVTVNALPLPLFGAVAEKKLIVGRAPESFLGA